MDYLKTQFHYQFWGWANRENFSQWKKLCLATQDDCSLWNCYSICLSHSSLRTRTDQVLKPQHEDTSDVFHDVPSHLVLGNKHSRTRWEFTFLPSFIMEVKPEWMQWTTMFICLLECFFCIILCAKYKKFDSLKNSFSMD